MPLRRRSKLRLISMLVPLLASVACFCACSRLPKPPAMATDTLDPAVAKLIESASREVRASRRSGAAWGKLASVLMHYDFQKEARFSFEQAEDSHQEWC